MYYFGTNLTEAGHYFWILEGKDLKRSSIQFGDTPFNQKDYH